VAGGLTAVAGRRPARGRICRRWQSAARTLRPGRQRRQRSAARRSAARRSAARRPAPGVHTGGHLGV